MTTRPLPSASERLPRIHLVQPPFGGGRTAVSPPLGLLSLAAVLEREGREVKLVDLNLQAKTTGLDPERSLRSQLRDALPRDSAEVGLVGVTTWTYGFDVCMEFVEEVRKRHPEVPIVLGGPHATFVDQDLLAQFKAVDYVLRDEGDWTFPRLVAAIEAGARDAAVLPGLLSEIPGLTWRRGGEVVRNPSGGVVEDLDALPFPAYHLIDPAAYLACQPVLQVEAGRGCPYNCNFCSTTNMFQRKYRVKTPARLVDEIEWAIERTGTNRFELLHDNLVASKKHVRDLCQEIRRRNIDVAWSCTSRTDNITEDLAQDMFLAGCDGVFFGVETLDAGRQQWTGKKLKPPMVHAAVELTARQHIRPTVGLILGFPEETDAELDQTLGAAIRWATEPEIQAAVSAATLRYYPGADLYAQHADALRPDPIAATDTAGLPGYRPRQAWKTLTRLFPLQAIHSGPEDTKRNITHTNVVQVLLQAAPLTLRACLEVLGLAPSELLHRLCAGRRFEFLKQNDVDLTWNEAFAALGAVVSESGDETVLEVLRWEVPFFADRPATGAPDRLEHVSHPLRFEREDVVACALGRRREAPRRVPPGQVILGVRAGRELLVCATGDPDGVLRSFRRGLRPAARGA